MSRSAPEPDAYRSRDHAPRTHKPVHLNNRRATMSNTFNQAVLVKALADLDLGINAVDTATVRMPYSAGAMDLRATRTVLDAASVRMPYSAGAMNLRATKTVLDAA